MEQIQINFLVHNPRRRSFAEVTKHYLHKVSPNNKAKIFLIVHTSYDKNYWHNFAYELLDSGIDAGVIFYPNKKNYMDKINNASKTNLPYSISLDEDVVLSTNSWNTFLENTDVLDNIKNLVVAPLISGEVGTVSEFFTQLIKDVKLSKKSLITTSKIYLLNRLYCKADFTEVGKLWGVDYSSLNKYTIDKSVFYQYLFYNAVEKIDHYYKGIHPLRILSEAQMEVTKIIIDNYDLFEKERKSLFFSFKRPYFTNHCYMIKSNVWGSVLNSTDLFKDDYDEVALNLFRRKNNMDIVFQLGSLGIHPTYNTIGIEDQIKIENFLIRGIYDKINKS